MQLAGSHQSRCCPWPWMLDATPSRFVMTTSTWARGRSGFRTISLCSVLEAAPHALPGRGLPWRTLHRYLSEPKASEMQLNPSEGSDADPWQLVAAPEM